MLKRKHTATAIECAQRGSRHSNATPTASGEALLPYYYIGVVNALILSTLLRFRLRRMFGCMACRVGAARLLARRHGRWRNWEATKSRLFQVILPFFGRSALAIDNCEQRKKRAAAKKIFFLSAEVSPNMRTAIPAIFVPFNVRSHLCVSCAHNHAARFVSKCLVPLAMVNFRVFAKSADSRPSCTT